MITWALVLAAFLVGLTGALTLEAKLISSRPHLYYGLAALTLTTAVVSASYTNQPGQNQAYVTSNQLLSPLTKQVDTHHTATDLPQPQITILPATNSAEVPEQHTPIRLTELPTTTAYLHIPSLNVTAPVTAVPLQDGVWDVSALGGQVGLLGGIGSQPEGIYAPVFAGHMTFPNNNLLEQGAFAPLQYATYRTTIIYQVGTESTVYEVSEISRIPPDAVNRLYLPDSSSILLITCTDWADTEGIYANRLLIRATLIETMDNPLPNLADVNLR